jgi:hypothetical protein
MRLSRLLTLLMVLALAACQATPKLATPARTTIAKTPTQPVAKTTNQTVSPTNWPSTPELATSTSVPRWIDFSTHAGESFADVQLTTYQSRPYTGVVDALPIRFAEVNNPVVIQGLTAQQKDFLSQNGFVVINVGDQQFKDLRRTVSNQYGQPYYLTTDAAYHALHVTFDELLASLEGEFLRPVLGHLLLSESAQVNNYIAAIGDTSLKEDAILAQNYLAVAIKLLYPENSLDPQTEEKIAAQIEQIEQYGGRGNSILIPNFEDDYGAYRPVGHYAGVPELECYFRSMTWLGRVAFKFKDPDTPDLVPSRAPLIMTLALREAQVDGEPAYKVWTSLYEITNFMIGPTDDPGSLEVNALMEQIYGRSPVISDLTDERKWRTFLDRVDELPSPQINSTFASSSITQAASRDWRFMGQRFTPDSFIFQSLIFDKVGTQENPRNVPSGLDVAAAFGSPQALQALDAAGETRFANYTQQMSTVRNIINEQPQEQWLNRFYSAWLYAFLPQVAPKDSHYPPYMGTTAWGYKEVNSLLGSWAELKHDTVLYAKMPERLGGGGPPTSGPAPAYVEPNPNVFYRLSYAASTLHEGLQPFINLWYEKGWNDMPPSTGGYSLTFHDFDEHLKYLAESLQKFGEIAERELQNQAITPDDYAIIQACLELKDCMDRGIYTNNPPEMDPIPVIAAVSGWEDSVLEAGVGFLDRIYVAVPLEGKLEIAQGGVFSYYEFSQPRSNRLTDQAWITKLQNDPPEAPAWSDQFILPGGKPTNSLAFRIGDVYYLSEKGYTPPLNLRASPSKSATVLRRLDQEYYLTIKDGPIKNSEGTWWKVEIFDWLQSSSENEGWVLENPEWFVRSVGE